MLTRFTNRSGGVSRNRYPVNKVMKVENETCSTSRLSANLRIITNILFVIDVFSEFLHLVLLRSTRGTNVASAFPSIFDDSSRRRPVCVQTDRDKDFLNKHFQEMLKRKGIQFQVCWNPDDKCSVVESVHRTNRDKFINISPTKIPTDISTFSQSLSRIIITRFTRRPAWRLHE